MREKVVHFSELTLDNQSNVPYLKHQGENYLQKKGELAAHNAYELERKNQAITEQAQKGEADAKKYMINSVLKL